MSTETTTRALADHPADWSATLATRSGLELDVRPARPDDAPVLAEMFDKVAQDDLRFRFLCGLNRVAPAQIEAMTHIDHSRTENFLAFDAATGEPVASAMVGIAPDLEQAEVAVSVRADYKNRGVGWSLLRHVARYAKARGIRRLVSIESSDNHRAIELEREMGFTARACPDDPSLVLVEARLAELA